MKLFFLTGAWEYGGVVVKLLRLGLKGVSVSIVSGTRHFNGLVLQRYTIK